MAGRRHRRARTGAWAAAFCWVLLFSLGPTSARAADGQTLSLEEVLEDAHARNAEIEAARGRTEAAEAMPAQARAWDDPTLSWEAWNVPDSFRLDHADNNIFRLSQKIPFPGKRSLAGEVASSDARRIAHEVESTELLVRAAVKSAYYALWEAHARVGVLERDHELVARLTHSVEGKYGTGEASQSEVLRLQVELTHTATQLETERLAIAQARASLAELVSRPSAELRGVPMPPPKPSLSTPLDELVTQALAHRPELLGEADAVVRDTRAVELAKKSRLPDFEVSFGRFVNDDAPDGFGALASVTLPLFNGGKYDAAIAEATARLAATRSDKRRLEDRVRREVEQAYLTAKTALLQHELFAGTHIPQAEQALRVTEGAYETSAAQFSELIDTLRGVQSVHLEHVAAQGRFERAYAELEQAVGMDLTRHAPTSSRQSARAEEHHE